MLYKPMEKIDNNQMITIGANINATLWVPQCCRANRPTNMTQAIKRSVPTVQIILNENQNIMIKDLLKHHS